MTAVAMLAFGHMKSRKRSGPVQSLDREECGNGRDGGWLTFAILLGAVAVSISGCAVGPNFTPPAAPDVAGYVPGKLSSPNPGPGAPRVAGQHFVSGADVSAL